MYYDDFEMACGCRMHCKCDKVGKCDRCGATVVLTHIGSHQFSPLNHTCAPPSPPEPEPVFAGTPGHKRWDVR